MSISYLSIGGNPTEGFQINNSGDGSSIYNLDGFIITIYIYDWRSFSKTDQEKVISKRRSLGIHKGQGSARTTGKAVTYTIYVNHLSMEASKLT